MIKRAERVEITSGGRSVSRGTRTKRVNSYPRLTLLLLAGLVTIVAAQDDKKRDVIDPSGCIARSASRISTTCDGEQTTVVRSEAEISISVELVPPSTAFCSGEIGLEYEQWDTMARVQGTLNNETCAASFGQYQIAIRIRDENGEIKTLEFNESWQRDDDQPVKFTADYPIGENVELIRLYSRRIRCSCVDTKDE